MKEESKNIDLIKFDLKKLKGKKVAVNCKTEEQFDNFVAWVLSLGEDTDIGKHSLWTMFREDTCLLLNSDLYWSYGKKTYLKGDGYEIVSYEEALLKDIKKEPKNIIEDNKPIKLSDFLKKNNCYEKFINNFDKEFGYKHWKELAWNNIYSAFVWKNTEEEYDYWDSIDDKWKEIKHKENDLINFFEDKTESKSLTREDRLYFEEYMKNQKETEEMKDALVMATERTNSNTVEEALKVMNQSQGDIRERASKISTLTEDDMLNVEEYMKNRREIKSKETFEEVFPFDKDEVKLLVEFLQNKINLTKETYERDINRYTSLMNKYQNILKEVL